MDRRRSLVIAVAAAGCALAIAACGGTGSGVTGVGTAESPTARASPIALARCMRANGVTNFPDPSAGGGLQLSRSISSSALTVNGVTLSGPVSEKAERTCKKYLPGAGGPPPPMSPRQKQQFLAFSRCMRAHGVPSFPDPTFPAGGGIRLQGPADADSPAFRKADGACGNGGFGIRVQVKP
jgi:hypothetical protein